MQGRCGHFPVHSSPKGQSPANADCISLTGRLDDQGSPQILSSIPPSSHNSETLSAIGNESIFQPMGTKAMNAAALKVRRPDLGFSAFIGLAAFLRTIHVRLFPGQGTVVIAIINAEISCGLSQSLSVPQTYLVTILSFL